MCGVSDIVFVDVYGVMCDCYVFVGVGYVVVGVVVVSGGVEEWLVGGGYVCFVVRKGL